MCPTFDVSPSEQRGRHEGSLAGNARLSTYRSRASSSRRHSRRVLELSRVLRTPEFLYAVRTSCRESDSPSVPTVAISRADVNQPLLHRHAPVFRAADSAETSHGAPRSTPAIPHSRSATRTNLPRHSVDHPVKPRFRVRAETGGATIPRGRFELAGGIEMTFAITTANEIINDGGANRDFFLSFFFPCLSRMRTFPKQLPRLTRYHQDDTGRDQCSVQGS